MRGALTMRTRPLDSAADKRRFTSRLLSIDPNWKPMAPPTPVPAGAGMFTTKFGMPIDRENGEMPAIGVLPSYAPPAAVTLAGKDAPVALPVAGPNFTSP